MKGIEITVIKDNGEKVIVGYYEPFEGDDWLTTNANKNEGIVGTLMAEIVPLKEKLDRQERMSEN